MEELSPAQSARRERPLVWYVAAGYRLPAGIEAYLLHYATEMRNHGFDTRIVVFFPLPAEKHRYLNAVEARHIPITSLYTKGAVRAALCFAMLYVPWMLYAGLIKRQRPWARNLREWARNRCAVKLLDNMIRRERPDIIHVKGRLADNAWPVFPSERTVYHHALMGTVEPCWNERETANFRRFLHRTARVFTPGSGVAGTMAREFRIERSIDPLFVMAPDEVGGEAVAQYFRAPSAASPLRFGILCRFMEQKGIRYILEALRAFKARHGDVHFLFAGQGDLREMIETFVREHELTHVRVAEVSRPPDVLKDMDVFVHPGLDEAMPVSIVEAFMCARPCITTPVGGTPDLVREGVEGFLVAPARADLILACMERFARMPGGEFLEFQKRARARYEEVCRPECVGRIVARHYRAILGGEARSGGENGRGDEWVPGNSGERGEAGR